MEGRHIDIIRDADGKQIVLINDILFKGKRSVNWSDVREYLRQYVGDIYSIVENGEAV